MKKHLTILALSLFVSFFASAQVNTALTADQQTRIRLAIPLITYDTVSNFQSAKGEAYYRLMLGSFELSLVKPSLAFEGVPESDRQLLDSQSKLFNELLNNPPTWEDLAVKQQQYLLWKDRMMSRHSKYSKP